MTMLEEKSNYVTIATIIGVSWLVVIILLLSFFYTLYKPFVASNAEVASQKRLDIIQAILKSYFGPSWPYTLLVLSLLFFFLGMALIVQSEGQPWTISIEKQSAVTTTIVIGAIFILLGIAIVLGFSYLYFFKVDPEMTPLDEQKTKQNQVFIFMISFISLFSLSWFGGFIYRKLKK